MDTNLYEVLGVATTAGPTQIKAAFRKQALKWHPDRHTAEAKALAHKRFIAIVEARDILSDPRTRQEYDLLERRRSEPIKSHASNPQPSPSSDFEEARAESAERAERFAQDFDAFINWLNATAATVSTHVRANKQDYSTATGAVTGAVIGATLLGSVLPPAGLVGARLGAWIGGQIAQEKKVETAREKERREREERQGTYCCCGCLVLGAVLALVFLASV